MNWLRSKKSIVTHSGQFHADEVFAIAILRRLKQWQKAKIIRTRNPEIISHSDLVLDVGAEYDPARLRFDHHQTGGAGKRSNGIPYASIGLIWKKYGLEICNGDAAMVDFFDTNFVSSIDSNDNGLEISEALFDGVKQYALDDMVRAFYPTTEENHKDEDKNFIKVLKIAEQIIGRELIRAQLASKGIKYVEKIYQETDDKRVLIFEKVYPWKQAVLSYPEPLFVVTAKEVDGTWGARAVPVAVSGFKLRAHFPEAWGGKIGEDLARISGVPDALFCHKGLFLATAKSKEGALKLIQIALSK